MERKASLKDKAKSLAKALVTSEDTTSRDRPEAEAKRDAEAQAKLNALQGERKPPPPVQSCEPDVWHVPSFASPEAEGKVGKTPSGLSSVPPAAGAGIDTYNMHHVQPAFPRHEAAHNTALRPDSQEMADGEGTAGDDSAI